jgi:hypothetical protein
MDAGGPSGTAPTWTQVDNKYLGSACDRGGCHSQMSTPSGAYTWLQGMGYINGPNSKLTTQGSSCLTYYGAPGNMPIFGGTNAQAVQDMNAWAAAGAQNN